MIDAADAIYLSGAVALLVSLLIARWWQRRIERLEKMRVYENTTVWKRTKQRENRDVH